MNVLATSRRYGACVWLLLGAFAPAFAGQSADNAKALVFQPPCSFAYQNGTPYEQPVGAYVCDYINTQDPQALSNFSSLSPQDQKSFLQTNIARADKAAAQEQKEANRKQDEQTGEAASKFQSDESAGTGAGSLAGTSKSLNQGADARQANGKLFENDGQKAGDGAAAKPGGAGTAQLQGAAAANVGERSYTNYSADHIASNVPPALGAPKSDRKPDISSQLPDSVLRNYSARDKADLEKVSQATSEHMASYYQKHSDPVAQFYSGHSVAGALTNLNEGGAIIFHNMESAVGLKPDTSEDGSRGCVAHQQEELNAARQALPADSKLQVRALDEGMVLQHHAVIVYPKDTDYKQSGVVLDAWPKQSTAPKDMVYGYPEWGRRFFLERLQGETVR